MRIPLILTLMFIVLAASLGRASVTLKPVPIAASTEVKEWRHEMDASGRALIRDDKFDETGLNECVETKEVSGVVICLSFFQADMNRIFGRLSMYAEGGYKDPRGTLASMTTPDVVKLNRTVQGHDLKSADLKEFFKKMTAACSAGRKELCLTRIEQEFFDKIYKPTAAKYKEFVILGFSYQAFDPYQANVGHEMMHAQYFLNPAYAKAVGQYWKKVTESDKAKIREILASQGYDPKEEDLMKNEFQAFLLQSGAEDDKLEEFIPPYRAGLIRELRAAGVAPVQIK